MNISKFKVEYWLNPLDDKAEYNLGSSCCQPVTVEQLLEMTGTDKEGFFQEISSMSLHYGYFEGMPRLKKAIAGLYTDAVSEDMILSVHGGTGANSIVCYALCEQGDNVVSILPNYQQYYSIPEAIGVEVRIFTCDAASGYAIDFDKIRAMVDENTKMINLANPNNPTGYTLTKGQLEELVDIAKSVDAYLVCDEIYRGLSDEYMYSICDLYEKGIATSSTSKVFSSAGTRVGWIVTRDLALKDTLMNMRSYHSICEGPINELIAAIVLENKDLFYKRNKNIVEEARAALYEWIKGQPHFKVACDSKSSTSFICYDFDIPALEFAQGLYEEKQVLVCHGACFEQEHSFRIGYGFGDVDYFKGGLARIGEYVKSLEEKGAI
ncbi:aminotransferase class I/II-fold pyridoxal phosphate-dependent enzyme [Aminipila butyrica]|uniref:Aminotransferase class I/II-fold pyridoxal phosphate-dependent enzyme n=1 Tax=Aminipila butyrica TaxID=433296 RepID=A0A858BY72_9FIRM|nr:aminotransferase class I/II-fold pyridoxal phosphate-dependent enzyme [Aminipila butyrica]QIB70058.1 aminotransferase class I/II-fold pyridoxal phosphate-dependent enzyme [Aminipila butyrica]